MGDAEDAKKEAMQRVEDNANPHWKGDMLKCTIDVAYSHPYYTSDHVYRLAVARGQWDKTHEPRALGPVMLKAAKLGIAVKANLPPVNSSRRSLHASPRQVWKSLIYEDTSMEGNMSGSINKVTIIGNLGADPETKNLNSGQLLVNMRVATSESWKDKNTGEKREKTEWHRITIWNENLAKIAANYLRKGSKVYLEGKLETRKWQAQDGSDRYSTEIILQGFNCVLVMLGDAKPAAGDDPDPYDRSQNWGNQQGGGVKPQTQQRRDPEWDDKIPF